MEIRCFYYAIFLVDKAYNDRGEDTHPAVKNWAFKGVVNLQLEVYFAEDEVQHAAEEGDDYAPSNANVVQAWWHWCYSADHSVTKVKTLELLAILDTEELVV